MTSYTLDIIPGTSNFVIKELESKHPGVKITSNENSTLQFESDENDVDTFLNIYSALRIHKNHGPSRNLFRREWKKNTSPAGINPSLAYILCMIADVGPDDTVYDPFCGAGTIIITAAVMFNAKKVLGSDLSGKAVDWTIQNANIAGISKNRIAVFRSNISQVKLQDESASLIITNPPYGIRSESHETNIKTYENFLNKSINILERGGKLVCITQEKELFLQNARKSGFEITEQINIAQSGLFLTIFIAKRNS